MSTETKSIFAIFLIYGIVLSIGMTSIDEARMSQINEVIKDESIKIEKIEESTDKEVVKESETGEIVGEQLTEYIDDENLNDYKNYNVPRNNSIKSYMDYRCITYKDSKQYQLQNSIAYTGNHGIRMVEDRYCVAVGSYYTTTIGQYIDIELENGNVIYGILADCKDDKHTDSTNRINPNGSVVEFVVDTDTLDETAKIMGDISYVNDWNSKIVNIKVYDYVKEF